MNREEKQQEVQGPFLALLLHTLGSNTTHWLRVQALEAIRVEFHLYYFCDLVDIFKFSLLQFFINLQKCLHLSYRVYLFVENQMNF